MASIEETTTLYRPVGQAEFDLIQNSGFRAFPPRLPEPGERWSFSLAFAMVTTNYASNL